LDQRLSTIPQHTWVSKLFGYDFQVVFQFRKHNMAANVLSRREEEIATMHEISAISVTTFQLFEAFREEAQHLPEVQEKREQIQKGMAAAGWSLADEFIMYQRKKFHANFFSVVANCLGRSSWYGT
jgi:hypothetical protein